MKRLLMIASIVTVTIAISIPTVALAVAPTDGGMAGGTRVTVNAGAGDQTDPHVSGDLVAYSDAPSGGIRYYSFLTNVDSPVPTLFGTNDALPDVFSTRISFSRLFSDRRAIMLFDTATGALTEVAPQVGSSRFQSALGGDTVAFVDTSIGNGDIIAYDLGASGPLVNLSADAELELNPNIAPSGDAVVWQRCNNSGTDCGVMKSVRSGGVWSAATLVADVPAAYDTNPDTDGTYVVYDSDRPSSTGTDIYYQLLSGAGAESQLEMAGTQHNPSISAGVIAFESVPDILGATTDIYVYVMATNMLVQVTNTPGVNELLNDVTVLPNGDVRVVWAADDGLTGDYNVYAQTFTPPAPPPPPPTFSFSGFLPPVDNLPTSNSAKAGSAIPVKFGLGGDFGLNIFAAGYPASQAITCSSSAPVDLIEETATAGSSGLSYDASTQQYTYVWKTDKAWAGTCRRLILTLTDGTRHEASFTFTK